MYASAAALAFGVSSCDKGPNESPDNTGSRTASGMTLDLVMPAGNGGSTRQGGLTYIPGSDEENVVESVQVFIFENNAAAQAVGTGGYTNLSPLSDYYDFGAAVINASTGVKTVPMKPNRMIPTNVGNVKVYVAFNLPADVIATLGTTGFSNEAALLAAAKEISSSFTSSGTDASITDADGTGSSATKNGFTMFSDASIETFVAVPPDGVIPTSNRISVDVRRVVSKALATYNTSRFPAGTGKVVTWTIDGTDDATGAPGGVQLNFTVNHWFIFQDVKKSFMAPNWDGATPPRYLTYLEGSYSGAWNGTTINGSAIGSQDDNIFPYEKSIARPNNADEKSFSNVAITNPNDPEDGGWEGTTSTRMYIGENVTRGIEAMPENTTLAWIATRVRANAKAVWSTTTPISNTGNIKWIGVTGGWGASQVAADTGADNIHVLSFGGKEYFAQQADVANIVTGVLYNGARANNRRIMNTQVSYPLTHVVNGVTTTYADFAAWEKGPDGVAGTADDKPDDTTLQGTDMTLDDFRAAFPQYIVKEFIYYGGYAHFPFYINMSGSRANLMRNQLIHLDVDDIKADAIESYKFPGYPGQQPGVQYPLEQDHPAYDATTNNTPYADAGVAFTTGSVRVPMDIFGVINNPDRVIPGVPIVPAETQITVQVNMLPWGYKKEVAILE